VPETSYPETSVPIVKTLATSLASRTAAKRLSRVIPNPLMRKAVVLAATAFAPMIARKVSARMRARAHAKQLARHAPSGGTPALGGY
jgi:hypothetical protein